MKRVAKEKTGTVKPGMNRRGFLKRGAAMAATAVGFPYIVPARALGLDGNVAPSNRIVMGCIGVGSQGTSNLEQFLTNKELQFVAVCDVDAEHRLHAKAMINSTYDTKDCAEYNDFRDLLAREDLDGVSIAVPDHWHSIPAIAAANRKLDIYAEKPLALTIGEGMAMREAVHRNNIVWQTGSWQRSQDHFRKGCELVRSGRIGTVHTVRVGLPTGKPIGPQPTMPVPEGFDYDFWLGPAPWAPYTEKRCHWNFRWNLDYSGGQLTDWAAHHCDIANWGMGTEFTGPVEVEPVSFSFPREGIWNAATVYHFTAKYPAGASPVAPEGFTMHVGNASETSGFKMGALFEGTEGWVYIDRSGLWSNPEGLVDSEIGEKEVHLYKSTNHARNFIDCVYSREKTITPIDVAQRAITIAHLGNAAMQLNRKICWDPAKEAFLNDAQAERRMFRAMRGEWRLG